ncbi:MAG TPA: cupin domain-containing protein [Nitrospira sp.]|nr:cupin domain-containing protein [Nitrospira sp.]
MRQWPDKVLCAAMLCIGIETASAADEPQPAVMDALRFAKQAEAAAAALNRDRFTAELDRSFQAALEAGAQKPGHRLAEAIHLLREASVQDLQGHPTEGREYLQSAIVWLSRAASYPVTSPAADWTAGGAPTGRETDGSSNRTKGTTMDHFLINIEDAAATNENFRKVLFTSRQSQLVLMSLNAGEDIGTETHDLDQFIRIESGRGMARLNDKQHSLQDGSALVIPAGTTHNIVNVGTEPLKFYTVYSPPEHRDGTIHRTKQDAQNDHSDHFDGKTTAMLQETR